jgi:hypothetical protein
LLGVTAQLLDAVTHAQESALLAAAVVVMVPQLASIFAIDLVSVDGITRFPAPGPKYIFPEASNR